MGVSIDTRSNQSFRFGIQTYLASVVLRVLLIAVHPGLPSMTTTQLAGLSSLGYVLSPSGSYSWRFLPTAWKWSDAMGVRRAGDSVDGDLSCRLDVRPTAPLPVSHDS